METRLVCFLVSEYLFPTTKLTWYHFWLVLLLGLGFELFYYLAILAKIKHKNMSVW